MYNMHGKRLRVISHYEPHFVQMFVLANAMAPKSHLGNCSGEPKVQAEHLSHTYNAQLYKKCRLEPRHQFPDNREHTARYYCRIYHP